MTECCYSQLCCYSLTCCCACPYCCPSIGPLLVATVATTTTPRKSRTGNSHKSQGRHQHSLGIQSSTHQIHHRDFTAFTKLSPSDSCLRGPRPPASKPQAPFSGEDSILGVEKGLGAQSTERSEGMINLLGFIPAARAMNADSDTDVYKLVCTCTYVCMFVCMRLRMYLCLFVCLYACAYEFTHICISACMYARTSVIDSYLAYYITRATKHFQPAECQSPEVVHPDCCSSY